jgi:hypothetical protein
MGSEVRLPVRAKLKCNSERIAGSTGDTARITDRRLKPTKVARASGSQLALVPVGFELAVEGRAMAQLTK